MASCVTQDLCQWKRRKHFVDRDINAAKNILEIGKSGERPTNSAPVAPWGASNGPIPNNRGCTSQEAWCGVDKVWCGQNNTYSRYYTRKLCVDKTPQGIFQNQLNENNYSFVAKKVLYTILSFLLGAQCRFLGTFWTLRFRNLLAAGKIPRRHPRCARAVKWPLNFQNLDSGGECFMLGSSLHPCGFPSLQEGLN